MPHQIMPHTADVRLLTASETLPGLFIEALQGMVEIMKPIIKVKAKPVKRRISVESPDRTSLLIDFLNEALSMSEINKETYTDVIWKNFAENSLTAELVGKSVAGFQKDIKAVTYHEAKIKQNKKGNWETVIVFDI